MLHKLCLKIAKWFSFITLFINFLLKNSLVYIIFILERIRLKYGNEFYFLKIINYFAKLCWLGFFFGTLKII
jgi:hypothetical protein